MSTSDDNLSARTLREASEADAVEQRIPVWPDEAGGEEESPAPSLTSSPGEADEADVWEQAQIVSEEDDGHDRDDA